MAKTKASSGLPTSAFDEVLMGWVAPEYLRFHRGRLWYVLMFGFDGVLLAYAYFSQSWTMLVLFALIPVILLAEHRNKPEMVEVVFSPYGIKFGRMRLAYSDLKAFWIMHKPPYMDELHLVTNQGLHPEMVIPLMGADPSLLRQFLLTQAPEWEGKDLSFLDILVRVLRLN